MSIPFDPTRGSVEYEYRCQVQEAWSLAGRPPVHFMTNWQIREYAMRTYDALCKVLPKTAVSMQRRTIRVEEYTP